MGVIKSWFHRQKEKIGGVAKKYLATLILVFLTCIYWEYLVINNVFERTEEYIVIFLAMAVVGTFFTESVLRGRKSKEAAITGYIFSGIGAFLWVIIDVIAHSSDIPDLTRYYFVAFAVLYVLVLVGLSLIALLNDSQLSFEMYFLRLVITFIRLFVILVVLNLGVLLILWMFDALITKIFVFDWLAYVEIMLIAFLYVPYGLSCLIDQSEPEQNRFARGMVLYALMPLLIAAVVIVYIYMGRLIITGDIPSNQIFPICAGVFLVGFVIWTMAYAYTRRNRTPIYNKIIRYFKYIYAPFMILEAYAIGVRVSEYGWTVLRLCCVAFIVIQFVYIAWEPIINLFRILFRKSRLHYAEHYEWIIFVILGVYVIAALIPWTSFIYLESASQEERFEDNWQALVKLHQVNRNWTPDEYKEAAKLQYSGRSIRRVLEYNPYGMQYPELNYAKKDMDRMFSINSEFWEVNNEGATAVEPAQETDEWGDSQYLSGGVTITSDGLDIKNYNKLYEATYYSSYDFPLEWSELGQVPVTYGDNQVMEINLTNCIKQMILENELASEKAEEGVTEVSSDESGKSGKSGKSGNKKGSSEDIYRVNAGNDLFSITQITFRYNPSTKQVRNLSISGYLLFR